MVGSKEEEEMRNLPSLERQKSQQLMFPVHQACVPEAQTLSDHL